MREIKIFIIFCIWIFWGGRGGCLKDGVSASRRNFFANNTRPVGKNFILYKSSQFETIENGTLVEEPAHRTC